MISNIHIHPQGVSRMKTKSVFGLIAVFALILGAFVLRPVSAANADGLTILKFGTMVGVNTVYNGTNLLSRGVIGAGAPWVIAGAEGKLTASGKLEVQVSGLVLDPNDAALGSRAGTNPIPNFRAVVSCQTASGGVTNVMTDLFPATTGPASSGGGNADIEARLVLPKPCFAPIVFVTSPTGAWFAVTGN
jgi:hypothetical protein